MKGSIGDHMQYGVALPHAAKLAGVTKLSAEGKKRLRWLDYYLGNKSVALTCRHFGISRSLFYKWFGRYRKYGLVGLEDKSRRPSRVRKREVLPEIERQIVYLRKDNPALSKYKVSCILKRDFGFKVSPSTINRIFHDKQLFWSKPVTLAQTSAKKAWKIRRIRAPRALRGACPGSLVEVDVKVLNSLGHTFYQFTAIDTCAKLKYLKVYSRKTAHCGQLFLEAMLTFYPFQVRHINSDNGGEFLPVFHPFL